MGFMARRITHVAAIGALLLAGCGSSQPAALPPDCTDEPASIVRSLARAPATVTLSAGTPLSRCVRLAAHRDGDLQALGVTLTRAADLLRTSARTDAAAALQLGYLVGAARRGAAQTPGLAAQLARRLEQVASLGAGAGAAAEAPRAELQRGIRLGEAAG
jgi:hypothetical protein